MLRFDGYYIEFVQATINDDFDYYHFLRFFPSGMVIGASIAGQGKPFEYVFTHVQKWLNEEYIDDVGVYDVDEENHITFFLRCKGYGSVEYSGEIVSENKIILNSYSHINGNEKKNSQYLFHKITSGNEILGDNAETNIEMFDKPMKK